MFVIDPSIHMWVTFAIIVIGMTLYALGRPPLEVTSLGIIVALLVFFTLFPMISPETGGRALGVRRIVSGFSEPALLTILSLLVMGQALVHTGALDEPVRRLLDVAMAAPRVVLQGTLGITLVFSGFLNNTPVVAVFIPMLNALAEKLDMNASRVMIPLSYAAILGSNLTLIGSSANLLVAGGYAQETGAVLGFFDITLLGALVGVIGFAYVALVAPRLLPDRVRMAGPMGSGPGKQFLIQLDVTEDSPLDGQKAISGLFPGLTELTIRAIQRDGEVELPPFHDITLRPGDTLVVAATRQALTDLLAKSPELLSGAWHGGGVGGESDRQAGPLPGSDRMLAEVMIAPASRLQGRTLEQVGFRSQTNCIVLGVQRRSRMIRAATQRLKLEPGDVLLVLGRRSDILALRGNRDLLLLEWSASHFPVTRKNRTALSIFFGAIAAAAFGVLPISVAALTGALLMLVTDCINVRQAGRALDIKIIMIIAAAIAMGETMAGTGGAAFIADQVVTVLAGTSPLVVLSAFFLLVAVLTNLLSNNATAVLFTPIAISIATRIGVPPEIFVVALIFAAKCSFATPFGYETNLLVMGPGHYRFSDFVRAGAPLVIIVWLAFTAIAGWYYDLL